MPHLGLLPPLGGAVDGKKPCHQLINIRCCVNYILERGPWIERSRPNILSDQLKLIPNVNPLILLNWYVTTNYVDRRWWKRWSAVQYSTIQYSTVQ